MNAVRVKDGRRTAVSKLIIFARYIYILYICDCGFEPISVYDGFGCWFLCWREWRLKTISTLVTSRKVKRISVVLHLFVPSYVAGLKAKFAENLHLVLSSLD